MTNMITKSNLILLPFPYYCSKLSGQELTQGRKLKAEADAEALEGFDLLVCSHNLFNMLS